MDGTEPLDSEFVADVLSRPPFVTISGVCNVRDIAAPGSPLRPNLVFRGAEVSGITEEGEYPSLSQPKLWLYPYRLCCLGKSQLRLLGITTVFDLRSDTEIEKYNSPLPVIDGVEVLRTPVFQKEDYSPDMMAKCVRVSSPVCLYIRSLC